MGDKTSISWTDATWNPIRGCRRTAPAGSKQSGCGDPTGGGCYAERQAARFCGPGQAYDGLITLTANGPRWSGKTKFVTEHLADPLRWKKPRRIFVDSMSDLFYDGFTNEQIAAVFGVMAAAPQHTFQVLTKRASRMREWFEWVIRNPAEHRDSRGERYQREVDGQVAMTVHPQTVCVRAARAELAAIAAQRNMTRQQVGDYAMWPLPNVWLGVSVENQAAADERIPELLKTPAEVRFLSCEPLVGPVDLLKPIGAGRGAAHRLEWVIVGCESGPGARETEVDWLRTVRDQCRAGETPFFLKQAEESIDYSGAEGAGGFADDLNPDGAIDEPITCGDGSRAKKRRPSGNRIVELPYLDGVQHAATGDEA